LRTGLGEKRCCGRPLFAVDIVCPLFDDLLRGPAAAVVPALLGGTVVPGLVVVCIDIFRFPAGLSRLLLFRWTIPPEMVVLARGVTALPLAPVPAVMPAPLPGLLLVRPALLRLLTCLPGFLLLRRGVLAGRCLLWLI